MFWSGADQWFAKMVCRLEYEDPWPRLLERVIHLVQAMSWVICIFGNLSRWLWGSLRFGSPWILRPLKFSQLIKSRILWKIRSWVRKERLRISWVSIMCQTFLHILPPLFFNAISWGVSIYSNFNLRFKNIYRTLKVTQQLRGRTFICIQVIWFPPLEPWQDLEHCSLMEF